MEMNVFFKQPQIKMVWVFILVLVTVFTLYWSFDDGQFNPTMIFIGLGFAALIILMAYIFRNNE